MFMTRSLIAQLLIALVIVGVFLWDWLSPTGYDEWLLYEVAILLTIWITLCGYAYNLAAFCTLLIVAGFFLSPPGASVSVDIFNRSLGIGILWISAILLEKRKQADVALNKLKGELENRVAERTAELRDKDQMLLVQSRQAAMGEMIGNIAHQWRQPLNTLGLTIQQLQMFYDMDEFTREFLDQSVGKCMELIQHMSKTIDDFRNFFRPDKEKVEFKVQETIVSTLSLIEDSFKRQQIGVELVAKGELVINGFRNEFAQVVLNILNNARDVLTEREIKDPKVTITLGSENDRAVVTISDNAGGIPEEIIGKIFDYYFTTKGPQAGTGIGLFMSKTIIEKNMGGMLSVRNIAEGAEFKIVV